jgi:transposase-like protein
MGAPKPPTSLLEAIVYFSDNERAFDFVKQLRWPNGQPVCPRCGSHESSFISTRRIWKCKTCVRQFSVKIGTIFEDSPIGFEKWLPCIWLIANSKNSISSCEVARALGVTQKTAWFMLHRVRLAMKTGSFAKLSGTVEVDESYIGGLARNMHARDHRTDNKTAVQGARERESGTVRAAVFFPATQVTAERNIRQWVQDGSTIYSDESKLYFGIERFGYSHKAVNHSLGRYVSGDVSTNGIENFWSLLKRSLKGTQTHVAPKHLGRYVAERQFAYNLCDSTDLERMMVATQGCRNRRLTYATLTR